MTDNAQVTSPDHDDTVSGLTTHEVEVVRARRASLRRAVTEVRRMLGTPDGGAGADGGADAVLIALAQLDRVWDNHTRVTESPDGMLEQILADAPRLSPEVARLRAEHASVAVALAAVQQQLAGQPRQARQSPELSRALDAVDRHRREGRELIYRAYQLDIGLGE
jgi:hypothetical protein